MLGELYMKCKCQICNAEIDTNTAYLYREYQRCDKDGNPLFNKNETPKMKREYCCNKSEYDDYIKLKAEQKAAEDEMWELVKEYVGDTYNDTLFMERAKWGDARKVCRLIKEQKNKFDFMKTKNFDRIKGKIMYFSAIVKNNIDDLPDETVIEEVRNPEPVINMEFYNNKRKTKLRKGLLDDE